jgi:hypothetical protein
MPNMAYQSLLVCTDWYLRIDRSVLSWCVEASRARLVERGATASIAAPADSMSGLSIDEFGADMILDEFLDAAEGSHVNADALTDPIAACEPGSAERIACVFAALDQLLPIGRKVVLTGLKASPELNDCRAVVIGTRDGERVPLAVSTRSGEEQNLRAKVWNLRPLGGMPSAVAAPKKTPSQREIKSATVEELLVIGREFAQTNAQVALQFLDAVQDRANEVDDLRSPWGGHLLGRVGMMSLVVRTMQAHLHPPHKKKVPLLRMGCLALWMMTCGESEPASNDSDASNERRQHAADAGAFPLLASIFEAYGKDYPEVCQGACMAIYNIAGGSNIHDVCPEAEGIRQEAAKAGLVEAVLSFLDRHAQKPNAGALSDGSKCYAEVGLKALGNVCHVARSADGGVQRADSLAAIQRCSGDALLATVTRLANTHKGKNPTVCWCAQNVMKICMQTLASGTLFDGHGDGPSPLTEGSLSDSVASASTSASAAVEGEDGGSLACSSCQVSLPKASYTLAQLKKKGKRRCKYCVGETTGNK